MNKKILSINDSGTEVEELQKLLKYRGMYYDIIDGLFNRNTEWAVKSYQRQMFLSEDGIVAQLTWKALFTGAPPVPPIPVLSVGSSGKYVRHLQRTLHLNNFYPNTIDDQFGYVTQAAVMTFQIGMNLPQDGVVGPRTWHALSKLYH